MYAEKDDKLLIIPKGYGDYNDLKEEITKYIPLKRYQLSQGERIQDRLKAEISDEQPN